MVVCCRNEIKNLNTSYGRKIQGFLFVKKCVIDGGTAKLYTVIDLTLWYYCLCFSWWQKQQMSVSVAWCNQERYTNGVW